MVLYCARLFVCLSHFKYISAAAKAVYYNNNIKIARAGGSGLFIGERTDTRGVCASVFHSSQRTAGRTDVY